MQDVSSFLNICTNAIHVLDPIDLTDFSGVFQLIIRTQTIIFYLARGPSYDEKSSRGQNRCDLQTNDMWYKSLNL